MKAVVTTIEEIFGLFVEDGSLAIGILVWLGIAAFVFPMVGGSDGWRAPLLFGGLIVLLMENVWRSGMKKIRK